jgi:Ca2+-binding RTX toxin-like protein
VAVNAGAGNDTVKVGTSMAGKLTVNGGGGSDTLVGPNATNTWNITGSSAGDLNADTKFMAVENLVGGTGSDTFKFRDGMGITCALNGGSGTDTLNYSAYTIGVTVNLRTGTATGVAGGVRDIENVTGGAGNDTLTGNAANNLLRGGAGNDSISGGGGNDILLGGAGNDSLHAGSGRSLLIGGLGADRIIGDSADDIVIGGTTSHDLNDAALLAILSEWKRTDETYQQRISHLIKGGGRNGLILLNTTKVFNDIAHDVLTGGQGLDWFFQSPLDTITDRIPPERVN